VEAQAVRELWTDDSIEEPRIAPYLLASAGANDTIIENYYLPSAGEVIPDYVCVKPDGSIQVVEIKFFGDAPNSTLALDILNRQVPANKYRSVFVFYPQFQVNSGIAFSGDLIKERLVTPKNEGVFEFRLTRRDESADVATNVLTKSAYNQLSGIPDERKQVILAVLNQLVKLLAKSVTKALPPFRLVALEDSSYLLEWTFEDRRLGFTFEADPKESGWYFVLLKGFSYQSESGTMDRLEISRLIRMMIQT